jgi:hypothetical protein
MEPGIYLTGMVFAVGVLHLATRLVTYVSRYYAASAFGQAGSKKAPVHRDDWYVFFHRSDLTGESESSTAISRGDRRSGVSPGARRKRDSRPVLRRYSA